LKQALNQERNRFRIGSRTCRFSACGRGKKRRSTGRSAQQEIVLLPLAEPSKTPEPEKKKKSEKPELPSVISKIYDLFS